MDLTVNVSNELMQTKRCKNCRYYLSYQDTKDDECINPESPKYTEGISEFDFLCGIEFYKERK